MRFAQLFISLFIELKIPCFFLDLNNKNSIEKKSTKHFDTVNVITKKLDYEKYIFKSMTVFLSIKKID